MSLKAMEAKYRPVFRSFVADGMSPEWARLEVAARVLQDAQIGQFDLVAALIIKMKGWKS